jgi:hypothetical protein
MPTPPRRSHLVRAAVLGVVAAAMPLLAACGSSGSSATVNASANLHVDLSQTGRSGPVRRWDVTCPSTTHAAACATLIASPDAFTTPASDAACTMIYGGPEVLTVDGTVGTRQVSYRMGRTNGCEIAAFTRDIALVAPFRRA